MQAAGVPSTVLFNGATAGNVGLNLNIPNSAFTIGSLNWGITNGTNTYNGTVNLTDDAGYAAQSIELVIGPVVAGQGYVASSARLASSCRTPIRGLTVERPSPFLCDP
jgi:hypothetical protein